METGYKVITDKEGMKFTSLLEKGFAPVEETALEVPVQEQLKDKANITVNKNTAIIQTSKEISIIL